MRLSVVVGIYAVEFFKPANTRDQVAGLVLGEHTPQFGFGPVGAEAFRLGPLALQLGFLLGALSQLLGAFGFFLRSLGFFLRSFGLLLGVFRLELRVFGAPALFV